MSSPSTRAATTLAPYAQQTGGSLRLKSGLSEEGYAADPTKAARQLSKLVDRGVASALCSHGPVLPDLVAALLGLVDSSHRQGLVARSVLEHALSSGMTKGEALVCHLVGTGESARVVAAERHHPEDRA